MKRVTYWNDEYGCWSYHCSSGDAAKLLAAYENTGLEPEEAMTAKEMAEVARALNLLKEYQSLGSVEHFRELSQAEQDGRLVVLPCKAGDTVYIVVRWGNEKGQGHIMPATISAVHIGDNKKFKLERTYIVLRGEWGFIAHIDLKKIGESVFLTKKEAEAALKGE